MIDSKESVGRNVNKSRQESTRVNKPAPAHSCTGWSLSQYSEFFPVVEASAKAKDFVVWHRCDTRDFKMSRETIGSEVRRFPSNLDRQRQSFDIYCNSWLQPTWQTSKITRVQGTFADVSWPNQLAPCPAQCVSSVVEILKHERSSYFGNP